MEIGRQKIRDYLLGKLPQTEIEEIDIRIISDGSLEADFVYSEDELIEDYLDKALSPEDDRLFRENFLVSEERIGRVKYIHTLREFAKNKAKEEGSEEPLRAPKKSIFRGLANAVRYLLNPVPATLAIMILILFAVFGLRFFLDGSDSKDLTSLEMEFAKLNDQDMSDLAGFQTSSIVNLVTDTPRDSNNINRLHADQLTSRVLFRVALPAGTAPDQTYAASLVKEGTEIFRVGRAAPYKNQSGVELRLLLPASVLTKGDFVLNVKARNAKDPALEVPFSVR